MAVADTGKWRADGLSALPTTEDSWEGCEFATPIGTPGSIFTQNANDIDVQINETGWYLAVWRVVDLESSDSNRNILRSRALHNSVVIEGALGTGWMRNANNDALVAESHCIFEVTSTGQNFRIEAMSRGEDATPNNTITVESELVLIRLPDEADVAYGIYTDGTDTGAYDTTAWDEIDWDTVDETNTAVIEAQDANTIRLKKVARYLICYSVTFQYTNRQQRIGRMTLAGVEIPQSNSHCYLRDTDTDFNNLTACFIVDNDNINQDLELEVQRGNCNLTAGARVVNESRLCIMELPSSAEVVIGNDATGGQELQASDVDLNFCRTTPVIDAASFTRNDNITIEVEEAADYLFMCNGRINRAVSTGTRSVHCVRWQLNQSNQQTISGTYIRGIQSSNYTYDGGMNGSFMANLSANDEISFNGYEKGDAGLGQTVGGSIGMCGLNIGTLISAAGETYIRTNLEIINLRDSNKKPLIINRLLISAVSLIDTLKSPLSYIRKTISGIDIIDSNKKMFDLKRYILETVNISDSLEFKLETFLRKYIFESVNITDSMKKKIIYKRQLLSINNVMENLKKGLVLNRFAFATVGMFDSIGRGLTMKRRLYSKESLNDSNRRFFAFKRISLSFVSLLDSNYREITTALKEFIFDSISLIDGNIVDISAALKKYIHETIALIDNIDTKFSTALKKFILDTVNIIENTRKTLSIKKIINSALSLIESIRKKLDYKRILQTSLNITGEIIKKSIYKRIIFNIINLYETAKGFRQLKKLIHDSLVIMGSINKNIDAVVERILKMRKFVFENIIRMFKKGVK